MSKFGTRPLGLALTLSVGAAVAGCHDAAPTLTEPSHAAAAADIGPGASTPLVPRLLDAPPSSRVFPRAINIQGRIVGFYDSAGSSTDHPAEWSAREGFRDLEALLGATTGVALAINDGGVVVGTQVVPGSGTHGVVWSTQGRVTDLGTSFLPRDINDRGQIAGTHTTPNGIQPAILQGGRLEDLGVPPQTSTRCDLPNACVTRAVAINQRGEVIATASFAGLDMHVAVWRPRSGWTVYEPFNDNEAVDINDVDDLLATNIDMPGLPQARLWLHAANPFDIGTLGGSSASSVARGLNDFGVVVGDASNTSGTGGAFRWTKAGGIERLPTIDGLATSAAAINNLGEIAGVIGGRPVIWTWRMAPR